MSVKTHVKNLAMLTGKNERWIDRVAANLRSKNLIQKSGHGPAAPIAAPEDVAKIVLAVMCSDSHSHAASALQMLGGLECEGKNFLDEIIEILSSPEKALEVFCVEVYRDYPEASIFWGDEFKAEREEVFTIEEAPEYSELLVRARITGGLLTTLAIDLERERLYFESLRRDELIKRAEKHNKECKEIERTKGEKAALKYHKKNKS